MLAVAAADRLAERAALEAEAATGAGGGQEVALHEERAHQRRPEEHENEENRCLHDISIGTKAAWDKIES